MFRFIFLVLFFVHSQIAFSWGPSGQTVTVAIAEKYLTPNAKAQVKSIIGNIPLSSVATWADQARNTEEWRQTGPWHYIDVASNKNLGEAENIRDAISYCQSKLESSISNKEKVVWLKFLIHFIGDLHQPMHVGDPSDRGGNQTRVSYHGKNLNLHALWDSSFIEEQGLTVSAFVNKLLRQSRSQSALRETFNTDIVIEENYKMRNFLYSFRGKKIDEAYALKASEVTDERLWTGGLRLAALLNEIFR